MAFGGGQDVCTFSEEMLDDAHSMPQGLKFSMAKGIMSNIVSEDEVSFVK
jgi:hypothetical protein